MKTEENLLEGSGKPKKKKEKSPESGHHKTLGQLYMTLVVLFCKKKKKKRHS